MTRRDFLAAAAVSISAGELSAQPEATPIVDPHLHLWDLTRFRLPWIGANDAQLGRTFSLDDYRRAGEGLNIAKAVYMEVDVAADQKRAEADFVLDLCRQENSVLAGAVIGGDPAADGFRAYLEPLRDNRHLKGVRKVLHAASAPSGTGTQDAFLRGLRLLGEWGLRFDLCMRPNDIGDAVRMVEAAPQTRFILDHCGNGPVYGDRAQWQRDIDRLARHDRVMCKISGIVAQARAEWRPEALAPVINHCLAAFGPDRVMFASDWPVCTRKATLRQWIEALRSIVSERPAAEQRKLFHDNAARFYEI